MGAMRIQVGGVEQPAPRGHKPWALLAYFLQSRTRVTRSALSALLFAEAKDPQAVLRWNLSELRRLLVAPEVLRGDPLSSPLGPDDTAGAGFEAMLLRSLVNCDLAQVGSGENSSCSMPTGRELSCAVWCASQPRKSG